jgi:hypothetical protein
MSPLIEFYRGTGLDGSRRRLADVRRFSDVEMELHHDYIQWLFPLREPSQFNAYAPLLTAEEIEAFRSDPELREQVRASFTRFLRFAGLKYAGGEVRPASDHLPVFECPNHNWLRITRIITSLRLLGLETEAQAFFEALEWLYESGTGITDDTFEYWRDAAEGAL